MHHLTCLPWLILPALLAAVGTGATHGAMQPRDAIRHAAGRFLNHQVAASHPGKRKITVGQLDPRLRLKACQGALQAFLPPGAHLQGHTTVGVRCGGSPAWTVYVSARISLFGKVLVATHPLGRGDQVSASDVRPVERDLSKLPYGYFSAVADARGKVVQRTVAAGAVLIPGMLKARQLVHRGDRVLVTAETGALQVQMAGKALSAGGAGDRVRVQALSSKRVVEGTVVRQGVVKVTL